MVGGELRKCNLPLDVGERRREDPRQRARPRLWPSPRRLLGGSHPPLANAGKLRRGNPRLPPVATVGERVSRCEGDNGYGAGHWNRMLVRRRLAGRPDVPRQLVRMLAEPLDPVPRHRDVVLAARLLAEPLQRVEGAAAELIRVEASLLIGARLRTTALL